MAGSPKKTTRRDRKKLVKITSCVRGKTGEKLSSDQICVQLPGNRGHLVVVSDDEKISSLKTKVATDIGVKERNWGIYLPQNNRLKIVEDNKQINQIDRNNLHFYPKVVIR